jgi:hypothetical protein
MSTLTTKLVMKDGVIDEEGSALAFASALSAYKAERELEEGTIAAAVHAQFSQYPGASQNMPALINGTLTRLNVTPSNYAPMHDKVQAFIRENSDRLADKKKGVTAEPERTRLFGVKKGVGGGVCRWSDIPVKAAAPSTDAAPDSE